MLFWYNITIFWDGNVLFSFSTGNIEKKKYLGPIRNLFNLSTVKSLLHEKRLMMNKALISISLNVSH